MQTIQSPEFKKRSGGKVTMARSPLHYMRLAWTKNKIGARLKVIVVLCLVVMFVTPLRNALVPGWPYLFRQLSTWKVIRIHLVDLFYYMDRTQYTGSCDFVHKKLAKIKMPVFDEMPIFDMKDWDQRSVRAASKIPEHLRKELYKYTPTLTSKEMKELMFATLSVSQALIAFNVSHFLMEGSLIGQWRHHGMIPWDDDTDFLFDVSQWKLAKQVLSCIPDVELDIGSDYMWKAFHKDSELWLGETFIKFPFVDLFPYKYDSDHLWPLTIWMKEDIILPTKLTLPPVRGIFEGWPIMVPYKTGPALDFLYGKVSYDCYSRTFLRREREMVPLEKRIHMPCKFLYDVFPFVRRSKQDKHTRTVLEERMFDSKVIFTFNTSFHGMTLAEKDN